MRTRFTFLMLAAVVLMLAGVGGCEMFTDDPYADRLEATLLGRARGSSDEDAGGGGDRSGGSPSAEAARFVRDKRAAADDVGWSDYQNNLTHSSLLMHELGATPASPKEALYGEDGRPKAHEASPPPAKERLRGTGRALRKFSEARAG